MRLTTGNITPLERAGLFFGLIGGLLYLVITKKGRAAQISIQRTFLMIIFSLYSGFHSVMVE